MINIRFLIDSFLLSDQIEKFKGDNSETFHLFLNNKVSKTTKNKLKEFIFSENITVKTTKKINIDKIFSSPRKVYGKNIKQVFMDFIADSGKLYICPYCGISPLIRRLGKSGNNVYNFELDHFLPKESFPDYGLSLYNLIPICKSCNQTFKSNIIPTGQVFHPYFGIINILSISSTEYQISLISNNDLVDFIDYNFLEKKWQSSTNNLDHHFLHFKLNEIYKTSISSYNDVKFAKSVYDKIKYYNQSNQLLNKDLFEKIFDNWTYKNNCEVLNYSNGKFRKDLINKIDTFL